MKYAIIIFALIVFSSCTDEPIAKYIDNTPKDSTFKMTFIEIGSDKCNPCIMMKPVMDSIQKKYGSQIIVKFIDAIKSPSESAPFKIRYIPTQVFLDIDNNEILRHEGFFHEDSIHKFLQQHGLVIIET